MVKKNVGNGLEVRDRVGAVVGHELRNGGEVSIGLDVEGEIGGFDVDVLYASLVPGCVAIEKQAGFIIITNLIAGELYFSMKCLAQERKKWQH